MNMPKAVGLTLLFIATVSMDVFCQTVASGQDVQSLIFDLRRTQWQGQSATTIPLHWDLHLTEPMRRILEIGSPAQDALIQNIRDRMITDQIIILLGGVGDERAIRPIITNMIGQNDLKASPHSGRINLAANIALTNITVADVIWHHGGGIAKIAPPDNSKERWMNWWKQNQGSFTVRGITQSRSISNYPNYGIYREP